MIIPATLSATYEKSDLTIVRQNTPKDKDYFLNNSMGMLSLHIRERGGISPASQGRFKYLRDYAAGKQDENTYKDYFSTEQSNGEPTPSPPVTAIDGKGGFTQPSEGKRKGYMNILWKVVSPAPKVMSNLLGKFEMAQYDIKADPIDALSGAEVENQMVELWALKENLPFLKQYYSDMGIDMKVPDYIPDTVEELKLYRDRGGFKAEHAMNMESLINWTTKVSNWKDIKKDLTKDLVVVGTCACMDYYDTEDCTEKNQYADPENLIIQNSKYSDFRDSEFAGLLTEMSVSELRVKLDSEGIDKDVYEPELQKCARSYAGILGNPYETTSGFFETPIEGGGWKYDFFRVLVFNSFWIDSDEIKDLISTNRYGKTKIYRKPDLKKDLKPNEKLNSTIIRKRFRCSHVVGTELIFNWGVDHNITRPNKKDVLLPIHAYKLPFLSITDQCIPFYDNLAIIWDKYQNNIATSINKGYVFDWDSFAELDKAGQNSMVEVLRRFMETGIAFSKKTNARGIHQTYAPPIQELEGGMGTAVQDFLSQLDVNLKLIENVTGFNPLTMGTVNPNNPVSTSEMAASATSDTLRPILTGVLSVKENMAKNVVLTIQLLLQYDKDAQKTYSEIIGQRGIKLMQIAEGNAVKYGINLEARPSDQEKRDLLESAKIALQSGRNGQPGITEADYFAITGVLNSGGSLRLAEMWLESSIRKNKKLIMEQAQANSTQQAQVQMQSAQAAEQMKTQGALAIIKQKGVEDRETLVTGAYLTALASQDKANADLQIKLIENYVKTGNLLTPEALTGQPMTNQNPPLPQTEIQDTGQNPVPEPQMQQ